jgi:hypothetical protein
MLRRLCVSVLAASLLVAVAFPAAAFGDGGRYRHGYDRGYRHGYHEGYERGYRRGYHDEYRDYGPYYYGYYGPRYCRYRPAPANVVLIRCYAFEPPRIHVPAGAAVVWSWDDYGVAHTVTADDGGFDSGVRRGGQMRLVFDHPGDFHYHCRLHPYMVGTVVVTP